MVGMVTKNDIFDAIRRRDQNDFCNLVNADSAIIPDLIEAFRHERDAEARGFIVEVIWQHRKVSAIPFLAEAIRDSQPVVWKMAMDGLVAMACPEALDVL